MRHLLLIRHAQTKVDPGAPAKTWRLEPSAYDACKALAGDLKRYTLRRIITSEEFKAEETGRAVAEALGIPYETAPNLYEHDRTGVPFMGETLFLQTMQASFEHPDKLVFGQETGAQARARFDGAVKEVLERYPDEPLAIVSHATVMSLFIAHYNELNPFTYWRTLAMPDSVSLCLPEFRLEPN